MRQFASSGFRAVETLFASLTLVIGLSHSVASAVGNTTVIALTGESSPDGNGMFDNFDSSVFLNDQGFVAVHADLVNTANRFSDDLGVYLFHAGISPIQLARESDVVPGGDGEFGRSFEIAGINESNQVAFVAVLDETSVGSTEGIFLGGTSGPTELVRGSQAPPDGNGVLSSFSILGSRVFNEAGDVVFTASLDDTNSGRRERGIFLAGDELLQFAREGYQAPDGRNYQSLNNGQFVNNAGQVAFAAATQNGSDFSKGIFLGDGTSPLETVVQFGDPAPDGNGEFYNMYLDVINDRGEVGFISSVEFTVGSDDGEGIFRSDSSGNLIQIARTGEPTPDGRGVFRGFAVHSLSDDGQLTFIGGSDALGGDTNDTGIYRGDGIGDLVQIVRSGQVLNIGGGTFVNEIEEHDVSTNGKGEIAFVATLQNTDGGSTDDFAILFVGNDLKLQKVARIGDELLGSTITGFGFDGDNLNDFGQVAYSFWLADGRAGIALWSIPEPPAAGLIAWGLLIASCFRQQLFASSPSSRTLSTLGEIHLPMIQNGE
jgi:hypothetical protein